MITLKVDLHVHSKNSDGTMSVEELINEAKKKKVSAFALTDHDTILGFEEIKRFENIYKIIPGIELSTYLNGKPVHILGYFKNEFPEMPELEEYLQKLKIKREERVKKILLALKEFFNIEVDYEEVKKNSHGVIARPHIARVIGEKYDYSYEEVFEKFLNDNSPAYFEIDRLSTEDGISLLKRNNAVTVLAHPLHLTDEMVKEIISYGIDGIEVYYPNQNSRKYSRLANKYQLLKTGGSDYHGSLYDAEIGISKVPEESYNVLLQRIKETTK